uniref:Deleted in malignant brain tumors 1 protein n=1 Tax=Schistocephalus solidus TaxID=70667 RepID=A0A0X3PC76_SCHSO
MCLGVLCFIAFVLFRASSLDVSGISSVRLATGSNLFPHGRDGVLEVKYSGQWVAVCNFGFDHIAASTACYMLGFPPFGVPILNSRGRSSLKIGLSNFNCSERVSLGPNSPDPPSLHLGNCEFTSDPPRVCLTHERDVSIMCLEPADVTSMTTATPFKFAPVTCPGNTTDIRLVGGTTSAGLVEVRHHKTGVWGTVCADGFGINEAKAICRMLCHSNDDLAYAHPVIDQFELPESSADVPIHLARIACPPGATSLNDCSLGSGWGVVKGCLHSMDVGVICAPQEKTPPLVAPPQLDCEASVAVVTFSKQHNEGLSPDMIAINGTRPPTCVINVTETDSDIVAVIPMEACGGTYELSNSTILALRIFLLIGTNRSRLGSKPQTLLPITCLVSRADSVISDVQAVSVSTLPPVVASWNTSAMLSFYSDVHFRVPISKPLNILPGQTIYARVSLGQQNINAKLVLRNCWVSAEENAPPSEKFTLITNGCPADPDVRLIPRSRTVVGFSFKASQFDRARPVGGKIQIFVGCETRLCAPFETDSDCVQFCRRLRPQQRLHSG